MKFTSNSDPAYIGIYGLFLEPAALVLTVEVSLAGPTFRCNWSAFQPLNIYTSRVRIENLPKRRNRLLTQLASETRAVPAVTADKPKHASV